MPERPEIYLEDFEYHLEPDLIAQEPLKERDHSRMLVLCRKAGLLEHRFFYELPRLLHRGDLLVFNDTRVIPARLLGCRPDTGGRVEVLLIKQVNGGGKWEAMVKPGRRALPGHRILFDEGLEAKVESGGGTGLRLLSFNNPCPVPLLSRMGKVPLPLYIKKELSDPESYQTCYSRVEGSVAAPTAGLHFTERTFQELKEREIEWVFLTLHIGPGTFRPVKVRDVRDHVMHSEYYRVSEETAGCINRYRREGRRVVAVGTTSCRVLETVAGRDGRVSPGEGWADLFIFPGYNFRATDALLTNFHLPRSTLLMLVCAFSGRPLALESYSEAVRERYRFYSFGDAMLIL